MEKVEEAQKPDTRIIRANGNCYYLDNTANTRNKRGEWRGFGGSKWNFLTDDGRVFSTRNLWHNGKVPERFKDRLPDNARILKDDEAMRIATAIAHGLLLFS